MPKAKKKTDADRAVDAYAVLAYAIERGASSNELVEAANAKAEKIGLSVRKANN